MLPYALTRLNQVADMIGVLVNLRIEDESIVSEDGVYLSHSIGEQKRIGGSIPCDMWQVSVGGSVPSRNREEPDDYTVDDIGEPQRQLSEAIILFFQQIIKGRIKAAI